MFKLDEKERRVWTLSEKGQLCEFKTCNFAQRGREEPAREKSVYINKREQGRRGAVQKQ